MKISSILLGDVVALLAAVLLGGYLAFSYYQDPTGGLPQRGELTELSGTLDWIRQSGRRDLTFGLKDSPMNFRYPSKAGDLRRVGDTLASAGETNLIILADLTDPRSAVFSEYVYFHVLEIRTDGRVVRSYEESSAGWRRDHSWWPYLGAFFVLSCLILGNVK